jgi:hypothetical protein
MMAPAPIEALSAEIAANPDHAWGWHCNIAMPIMDATGVSHELANQAAAHLMQHLFGYDITTDERYQYQKSNAQSYAEIRIAADIAEDAEIAARGPGSFAPTPSIATEGVGNE